MDECVQGVQRSESIKRGAYSAQSGKATITIEVKLGYIISILSFLVITILIVHIIMSVHIRRVLSVTFVSGIFVCCKLFSKQLCKKRIDATNMHVLYCGHAKLHHPPPPPPPTPPPHLPSTPTPHLPLQRSGFWQVGQKGQNIEKEKDQRIDPTEFLQWSGGTFEKSYAKYLGFHLFGFCVTLLHRDYEAIGKK